MKRLLWCAALAAFTACVPRAWLHPYKNPLTVEEHMTLARLYHEQGQGVAALKEAEAAVRRSPENQEALFYVGDLYVEQARWAEAIKVYRRILKRDPQNGRALNNLAMSLYSSGNKGKEAERSAERALAVDPTIEPYVLDTLLQITLSRCEVEKARAYLQRFRPLAAAQGGPFPKRLAEAEAQWTGCAQQQTRR